MEQLQRLLENGQSYWLDNLSREKIVGGELKRRVEQEGLRGITSNPSTFSKAISGSSAYDDKLRALVKEGRSITEIYEHLAVEDVRDACDILRPVYEESGGVDGYVSLEVSPHLAHDTAGTKEEARRLFSEVDRPNAMIKIPGTEAGLSAIEQMLYEGININVTLLFSLDAYESVTRAYLRALERREAEGKSLDEIASVASFFLSRIDVFTDQVLSQRIIPEQKGYSNTRPEHLFGKAAIASAKLAYQRFLDLFSGPEWKKLSEKGASVQRPLWASTSTKDPLYSDVRYVEPLIGPNTVNTIPENTIAAFIDHGEYRKDTLLEEVEDARRTLEQLQEMGIDLDLITSRLVQEGIQKFIDPFNELLDTIAGRRAKILEEESTEQSFHSGQYTMQIGDVLQSLDNKQYSRRMFAKDGFLWTEKDSVAPLVKNRLGWLDCPVDFGSRVTELRKFTSQIAEEGFAHVVLLGMGGSSLCPEVAMETFGSEEGYPELIVLDNTDPDAVSQVEDRIHPESTLFIVASKSGTTTETTSFYRYFYQESKELLGDEVGQHWVAITDPDTPLVTEGEKKGFRRVFTNPVDIGGRYSALSYFGLVPMALIGVDLEELLDRAFQFQQSSRPFIPAQQNPGLSLGVMLGEAYRNGVGKITFFLSDSVAQFGAWVEQLLAESTGKEGEGLVPVVDESPTSVENYDDDRLFVHIHCEEDPNSETHSAIQSLEQEGYPVIKIRLNDTLDLGTEFLRWELATATVGKMIGINPFDEPNVTESKENTRDLLSQWAETGTLGDRKPVFSDSSLEIYGDRNSAWLSEITKDSPEELLSGFLDLTESGDYFALLGYFLRNEERDELMQNLRHAVRDRYRVATTAGYGPRYLHSTGQLHKGGPNTGIFLLLTADSDTNRQIPGAEYDFQTLQRAQALGDYQALCNKRRRVIRVHFNGKPEAGLKTLSELLI